MLKHLSWFDNLGDVSWFENLLQCNGAAANESLHVRQLQINSVFSPVRVKYFSPSAFAVADQRLLSPPSPPISSSARLILKWQPSTSACSMAKLFLFWSNSLSSWASLPWTSNNWALLTSSAAIATEKSASAFARANFFGAIISAASAYFNMAITHLHRPKN